MKTVDPLAAMQAACIAMSEAVGTSEIEMEWTTDRHVPGDVEADVQERITITVRREARHFYSSSPGPGREEQADGR
jgi:hypothetical protein